VWCLIQKEFKFENINRFQNPCTEASLVIKCRRCESFDWVNFPRTRCRQNLSYGHPLIPRPHWGDGSVKLSKATGS
jgi:hypothetical protein